jgi:hypothetical protein
MKITWRWDVPFDFEKLFQGWLVVRPSEPSKYNPNFTITDKINLWYDHENQVEPKKKFV